LWRAQSGKFFNRIRPSGKILLCVTHSPVPSPGNKTKEEREMEEKKGKMAKFVEKVRNFLSSPKKK